MSKICPSVICFDFLHLQENYDIIKSEGINKLHIDIMDGVFVPQITIGSDFIKQTKKSNNWIFADVHLMIIEQENKIEDFIKSDSDSITFHYEGVGDNKRCIDIINQIHNFDKLAGISVKPNTDIEVLFPILEKVDIDSILIMSVEPGFSGQKFIKNSIEKVKKLNNYLLRNGLRNKTKIQIDGGINEESLALLKEENLIDKIDNFVIGSALHKKHIEDDNLQKEEILKKNIKKFQKIIDKDFI